jgi:hypothetical protein
MFLTLIFYFFVLGQIDPMSLMTLGSFPFQRYQVWDINTWTTNEDGYK